MESSKLKKHAGLFDRMACAQGLDLQEEAIAGRLPFDEIAEAVLRCSRCGAEGACRKWLSGAADQRTRRNGAKAPDFCRNRDLLAYLNEMRG
ncbi:DUF6455 family protein [Cribrihabitans neustonicus]|uniref:DUF6455 family protein n=1 Tax=Cribrihabitans neustonicus TaxID=1429085 RepID=UPI003B5A98EE